MLREHAGVPRCLETTANRRTHPFILGKFELLGHVDEVLDTNERRCPALPLHMPRFLEQACHAVLEIHRRHVRQTKPRQHGHQRTESELPYAELEVISSLEMDNAPVAHLPRSWVGLMFGEVNVFFIQVKYHTRRPGIDEFKEHDLGEIRLASPFDASNDVHLLQVMAFDKEWFTPQGLAEVQRIPQIVDTVGKQLLI